MASRISELVIDCHDPKLLADFWCQVLAVRSAGGGGRLRRDRSGGGFGGLQPTLSFSPTTELKTTKLRLHIDVNAVGVDQDAELERLLALGARPADIGQTGEENWHVLQDPKGNEFFLLRRRAS